MDVKRISDISVTARRVDLLMIAHTNLEIVYETVLEKSKFPNLPDQIKLDMEKYLSTYKQILDFVAHDMELSVRGLHRVIREVVDEELAAAITRDLNTNAKESKTNEKPKNI